MIRTDMVTPDKILSYWFGELADDAECAAQMAALWWQKGEKTDCDIAARFGESLEIAMQGGLDDWSRDPRSLVALIILLDQFSRNIYRGTRRAFEQDTQAFELCRIGVDAGTDMDLRPIERVFFYLPLEHAESIEAQQQCVALYEQLRDDVEDAHRATFEGYVDYANKHREVIEKFGRFPHRNAILGRDSTPQELEYLAQPGAGF
ncbi:MAG: DUF924 domain-containing protein [Verrucomicrobia bacterium]|nr:DUF924 domain-containing protein [Verrucomicrobiota bacterium]MDA1086380.1 DUF924 domain-containing protein [Verrucomicrobiota bacterium]